jgi:hypothetical protein
MFPVVDEGSLLLNQSNMAMLEPDWEQARPTFDEVKRMWAELNVSNDPLENPAIDELLKHLRSTHSNGGAEFARFAVSAHPVLHWFGSRNRLEEIDFFTHLVSHPSVVATFSPVITASPEISLKLWGGVPPFTLAGELAWVLVQGGAYDKFSGTAREAMNVAGSFCDALFGDRFTEILQFKSHESWTGWFYNVAWDGTWLGFDKRESKVWLLCITDTD